jgi:hypothetical protein
MPSFDAIDEEPKEVKTDVCYLFDRVIINAFLCLHLSFLISSFDETEEEPKGRETSSFIHKFFSYF